MATWLLLSYRLPAEERSAPRVAVWRALKRLGGAYLADGAYVLEASEYSKLALGQLAHDIRNEGGEASVLQVQEVDDEGHFRQRLSDEGPRAKGKKR